MAATNTSVNTPDNHLVLMIQQKYPEIVFKLGERFSWSPYDKAVSYPLDDKNESFAASLLHECGHALLGHSGHRMDIELLEMEAAAWLRAKSLAVEFDIDISEDRVQDCLDTYRDWVHQRSICPVCDQIGLQSTTTRYNCINCPKSWSVAHSKLCRVYRRSTDLKTR